LGDDKMSEVFTINTEEQAGLVEPTVEPFPLFDENHPMLAMPIPEYNLPLPNPSMTLLSKRLRMTMKLYNGIGLSANQCGVFQRVFVMGTPEDSWACINPRIVDSSPDFNKDKEGCLSFPGLTLNVERPEWIMAEFINENGKVVQMRMEGLTARCFQHELDHMNGVKFTSYVKPVALQLARERQNKLIKKIKRMSK
jgi:peptide deformylase